MQLYSFENASTAKGFRIGPTDTNYFAVLFDQKKDDIDNIFVIEVFNVGGATHRTNTRRPTSSST